MVSKGEKPFDMGSKPSDEVPSPGDVEKQEPEIGTGTTVQLQRRLQSRHLQMIAIGGTIVCLAHNSAFNSDLRLIGT